MSDASTTVAADVSSATANIDASGARLGLLDGLSDRLNPILVKEVRQSLQGKFFRWMFLITLVTATVVASARILLEDDIRDLSGPDFFIPMYACLSAAVHVFVPFSVFTSLGAEWEENTFDLLVISGLKPRQIALGKLLSATVQLVLYFSAFGPFLAFAFLLKGLDLTAVAVILGGTVCTSTLLSGLALGFSSLSKQRVIRVLVLTALAGAFVQSTGGSVAAAYGLIRSASTLHHPDAHLALYGFVTAVVLLCAFFYAIACSRLAHPEENRSSALRALALVIVGAGIGWMLWFVLRVFPLPPSDLQEVFPIALIFPAIALLIPSVFFVTEPERLGRRVYHTVPRNPILALLAAPFLPGGGRGFLLLLLELGVLAVAGIWARTHAPNAEPFPNPSDRAFLAGLAYALIYLGLPTALLAKRAYHLPRLILARLSVPVLIIGGIFLPSLARFFLGYRDPFQHLAVPPWVVIELFEDDPVRGAGLVLPAVCALAVLVNVPRMWRGVAEVLAASAERRSTKRPQTPTPADDAAPAT